MRQGSAMYGLYDYGLMLADPRATRYADALRRFVAAVEAVAPGRGFLLYSYCVTSPLPWRTLGLSARREAWTPANLPPASVWRYRPIG